jgi:hypothetical protein
VPLVVEKLVSAHSKNLTGFYIQPDTGFSFADLRIIYRMRSSRNGGSDAQLCD